MRYSLLLAVTALFVLGACTGTPSIGGGACTTDNQCEKAQSCVDGNCQLVNSECTADATCTTPGGCGLAEGAYCEGGTCHYPGFACGPLAPPSPCRLATGSCDPTLLDGTCSGASCCTYPPAWPEGSVNAQPACPRVGEDPNGDGILDAGESWSAQCSHSGACIQCETRSDCDDGNSCTVDTCGPEGECSWVDSEPGVGCRVVEPADGVCAVRGEEVVCLLKDGEACTASSQCLSGACDDVCQSGGSECSLAGDCTTPDVCEILTGVECTAGYCNYPAYPCEQSEPVNPCRQREGVCNPSTGSPVCEFAVVWPEGSTGFQPSCPQEGEDDGDGVRNGDEVWWGLCGHDGACQQMNGEECASNSECQSNECECGDVTCTDRFCAPDSCTCKWGTNGACTAALGEDLTDPGDCEGAYSCLDGDCVACAGEPCEGDWACGSGFCECANADCTERVCAVDECQCSYGEACLTHLDTGVEDPGDCEGTTACYDGACKKKNGQGCTEDYECASLACECANATCSARACAEQCICRHGGGGACTLPLDSGINDPADCEGVNSCYGGECLKDAEQPCTADAECGSGNCECTTADCATRKCAIQDCLCNYGTGGACSTPLSGDEDPEDCMPPGSACVAGACIRQNGETCTGDDECVSGNCECALADCSLRVCAADDCTCHYGDYGFCLDPGQHLVSGIQDPGDCDLSDGHSCWEGNCLLVNGQTCTADAQCGNGNCECAGADCAQRVCAANNCFCKWSADGGCEENLPNNSDDPEDCAGATAACYDGECLIECTSDAGCPNCWRCNGNPGICVVKGQGVDCGVCKECDGQGSCVADDTQDSDCGSNLTCGWCSNGACQHASTATSCGSTCMRCDGDGGCVAYSTSTWFTTATFGCAASSTDYGICRGAGLCDHCTSTRGGKSVLDASGTPRCWFTAGNRASCTTRCGEMGLTCPEEAWDDDGSCSVCRSFYGNLDCTTADDNSGSAPYRNENYDDDTCERRGSGSQGCGNSINEDDKNRICACY